MFHGQKIIPYRTINFMKNIRCYCSTFCFIIACFIISSGTHAQEPVAPSRKLATVKGLRIYYEDTGKGTPLILLHGFTGTSSMWKPFIPTFAKFYRVISIDLPGHGRSDYIDTTEVYSQKKMLLNTFLHFYRNYVWILPT